MLDACFPSEKLSPELEAAVNEYASRPKHSRPDSQTEETLCELREDNVNGKKQFRWQDQDDLAALRLGRPIHFKEFLKKLNTIVPARYAGWCVGGLLSLECGVSTNHGIEWRHICGAQPGLVPEYSTMYFDDHGLPTSEMYRGWRTVLLRLIIEGVISEEQAHKTFGEPRGPEGSRYRQQLYYFRNRKYRG